MQYLCGTITVYDFFIESCNKILDIFKNICYTYILLNVYSSKDVLMNIYTFSSYTLASNSYVLVEGGSALIIDPSVSYDEVIAKIPTRPLEFKYIVITHSHFDHILKINDWTDKTSASVIVGRQDKSKLSDPIQNCYKFFFGRDDGYFGESLSVSEGDKLFLEGSAIKILETPGHTSGSISLLYDKNIFVGDLVFADGGVGRTDLPTGNFQTLLSSIDKIRAMPDEYTVYCGHGRKTNVKEINNSL